MADFAATLKEVFNRSVKAVNKAANGVASATRYKMNEMDGVSRRREAVSELGEKVYGLFQAGIELPEEIVPLVNEIRALDDSLDTLRSDRAAAKEAAAAEAAAVKAARKQERAEAKEAAKAAKEAAAEEAPSIDFEPEIEETLTYTGVAPTMEDVEEAEATAEEDEEEIEPTVM